MTAAGSANLQTAMRPPWTPPNEIRAPALPGAEQSTGVAESVDAGFGCAEPAGIDDRGYNGKHREQNGIVFAWYDRRDNRGLTTSSYAWILRGVPCNLLLPLL